MRVDVFYQNFTPKQQAWVNLVGTLFFLLPFCFIVVRESWQFTVNAWDIQEGSPDPGGLPGRYIVKAAIPIGFLLLLLQGLSLLFRSVLTLTDHD